jgi:hypothetical protein
MAVPKQVQDQVEASNRIAQELANGNAPVANQENAVKTDAAPAQQPVDGGSTPTATPAVTTEQPTDDQRMAKLEHALSVLQGKYSAEVPRLTQQLRQAEGERDRLIAELEGAKLKADNAVADKQRAEAMLSKIVPEGATEEFGDSLMKTTATIAQRATEEANRPIMEEIIRNRKALFASELSRLAPDWQEVNQEGTGFFEWLGEVDPLSGASRQQMLDAAINMLDSARVAKFILSFQKTKGAPAQTAATPATPASNLQRQVAPARATGATPPPAKDRIYSAAEYGKIINDLTRGVYSPADAARIKTEIDKAFHEGRIRTG